ncbi:MAG: chemotaxis protein CheX [Dehalococcoidia bacterium]
MPDQMTTTLTEVFSEVLSDLAFLFTDEDAVETTEDDLWLETVIGYQGSQSGALRLRCTRRFSILLAANLLGADPEDADAEDSADDAVKEFMNIVCGQFVTAVHGTKDVFQLTIPQIAELPGPPDLSGCDGGNSSRMTVEGQPVQLTNLSGAVDAPTFDENASV